MVLLIKREGIFTSLQDLGRFGLQRFGINPCGAMDQTAARIVNLLLGNNDTQLVLESHFPGPELAFEEDCRFALGGADFAAELDGEPIANWHTHAARMSSVLRFRARTFGNRSYLAIKGGLRSARKEPDGVSDPATRRLEKGERILRNSMVPEGYPPPDRGVSRDLLPKYSRFPTVRIIAGAEFERLADQNKQLETGGFALANESNRMGFRLQGPALKVTEIPELVSAAVTFGTIQLLPDGQLVVLMADHQTSGGYPRIGNVISADLPLLAQLGPGDKVAFKVVNVVEAEQVSAQREMDLNKLRTGVSFGRYW